jgi:hypothetical protein
MVLYRRRGKPVSEPGFHRFLDGHRGTGHRIGAPIYRSNEGNEMNSAEAIFFWVTALFMAISFLLVLSSAVFKKPKAYNIGRMLYIAAFIAITVFGIIRWVRTGHPPFVTLFESMITAIWFVALIYHLFRLFHF